MKAIRLVAVGRPLEMQDIPIPAFGEKDILVKIHAAGICHSDVHYRNGLSPVYPLPMTLGHEVAGVVEEIGRQVTNIDIGERVCLHYNLTCGDCYYCTSGNEQFCEKVRMLGHHAQGGYAEYITIPARNAIHLPDELPFDQGATLMCASATAFHALRKSRLEPGEVVAIFGVGGLGLSAVQLAKAFGALTVFAVDINEEKLKFAAHYGAIAINAQRVDPVLEIRKLTNNKGADVAIEMIGLPKTMRQAIQCLGILGRAVIVGLGNQPLEIDTYHELLGSEREIIGSNDHLLQDLSVLVEMARRRVLDLSKVVTRTIPLDPDAINAALDALEGFSSDVRTVIVQEEAHG
jgi:2-desacetyl-2-hydroxyethyl bacteriochlorophyllide A dehydrogenase